MSRSLRILTLLLGLALAGYGGWVYLYPHESAAFSNAADLIADRKWSALYELQQGDEQRMIGWTRDQFVNLMKELDSPEFSANGTKQIVYPRGGSRLGALYSIGVVAPNPNYKTLEVQIYSAGKGKSVGLGDIPFQFAILTSKDDAEGLRKLASALQSNNVKHLINTREMLRLSTGELAKAAPNFARGGKLSKGLVPWRRLPGF